MEKKVEQYQHYGATMTHTIGKSLTPHDQSPGDFLDRVKKMIEGGEIHQLGMKLEISFSDGAPHPNELKELENQITEMESQHWNEDGDDKADCVLYATLVYSNEDDTVNDELGGHLEE